MGQEKCHQYWPSNRSIRYQYDRTSTITMWLILSVSFLETLGSISILLPVGFGVFGIFWSLRRLRLTSGATVRGWWYSVTALVAGRFPVSSVARLHHSATFFALCPSMNPINQVFLLSIFPLFHFLTDKSVLRLFRFIKLYPPHPLDFNGLIFDDSFSSSQRQVWISDCFPFFLNYFDWILLLLRIFLCERVCICLMRVCSRFTETEKKKSLSFRLFLLCKCGGYYNSKKRVLKQWFFLLFLSP